MSYSGDSDFDNTGFEYDPDVSDNSMVYPDENDDNNTFSHIMDESSKSSTQSENSELTSSSSSVQSEEVSNLMENDTNELLEENNNDPNNNLDDENEGISGSIPVRLSPQPGCSKHFDKVEGNFSVLNNEKLLNFADDIMSLVSKITRESVLAGLRRKNLKNVTLQDLAPENDNNNLGIKRHNSEDICTVDAKKASNLLLAKSASQPMKVGDESSPNRTTSKSPQVFDVDTPPGPSSSSKLNKANEPKPGSHFKLHVPKHATLMKGANNQNPDAKNLPAASNSSAAAKAKAPKAKEPGNSNQHLPSVANKQNPGAAKNNQVLEPKIPALNVERIGNDTSTTWKAFYRYPAPDELIKNNVTVRNSQTPQVVPMMLTHNIFPRSTKIPETVPKMPAHSISTKNNQIPRVLPLLPGHNTSAKNTLIPNVVPTMPVQKVQVKNQAIETSSRKQIFNDPGRNNMVPELLPKQPAPYAQAPIDLVTRPGPSRNQFNPFPFNKTEEARGVDPGLSKVKTYKLGAIPKQHPTQTVQEDNLDNLDILDILNDDAYKNRVAEILLNSDEDESTRNASPDLEVIEEPCAEIYNKLRAMFPMIDRNFIKKYCPPKWSDNVERDVEFGTIVEKLLADEGKWVIDNNVNNPSTSGKNTENILYNVDETHEYLTGIFPDADPHFLRKAAERAKTEDDLRKFVEETLKNPNYQTREQYMAKLKLTEEQKRYTDYFSVEHFISIFPDPIKHFEDPARKCEYVIIINEFLKHHFNRLRANTINRAYAAASYNLSLTAKQLRKCNEFMKSKRQVREILTENIPMLQEMAFVKHYEEITTHLEVIKRDEIEEFNRLKAAGKLLTCQCCYDDQCMESKCSTCDNGHIFCNNCIITGTDSKLGDGETHVPCFIGCGSEFSISTLQRIIPPTKFSILLKKRQAAEVMAAGLEGLVSCPFCHFASIPPEGDKVFKCLNPECMKESCRLCQEKNHVPLRCDEVDKADKARKYIEEKMTQALARNCYQCKRPYFKEEGCNKINCPCGAIMCYLCNKPIKDYQHFRGQGSDDKSKCPLWSDNQRLNAEIVRRVAEDARKEVLQQNSNLSIDTERLQPALPPPTVGPHADILNVDNLAAELAARVMQEELH